MWRNLNSFACDGGLPVWPNLNSFASEACLCGRICTGFACEACLSGEVFSSVTARVVCMYGLSVWRGFYLHSLTKLL